MNKITVLRKKSRKLTAAEKLKDALIEHHPLHNVRVARILLYRVTSSYISFTLRKGFYQAEGTTYFPLRKRASFILRIDTLFTEIEGAFYVTHMKPDFIEEISSLIEEFCRSNSLYAPVILTRMILTKSRKYAEIIVV